MAEDEYAELNLVDQCSADPEIQRCIPVKSSVRLGRVQHHDYADVAIKSTKFEAMVSRKHATIKKTPSGWVVIDHKSTNGVLVNKQPIVPEIPFNLKDGDEITFGTEQSDLVYTFEINRRKPCGAQEHAEKELQNLKICKDQGWFNQEQYDERKHNILQSLPPAKWMLWDRTPKSTADIPGISEQQLNNQHTEMVFRYNYNFRKHEWQKSIAIVVMDEKPFDEGAMRLCYHMTDLTKPAGSKDDGERRFVAKQSKEGEPQHTYFMEVEMQGLCMYFAEEFNKLNPPKKVQFIEACVVECFERPNKPVFACEPFIEGKYIKYNNNWGYVSPEDRNTPQAFSHFTYHHSSGFYLVCDIQGVGDRYTDPQVHSKDKKGFGKGNMGVEGINRFFATHECNSICVHLGIETKRIKTMDDGTRPPPNPRRRQQPPPSSLAPSSSSSPGPSLLSSTPSTPPSSSGPSGGVAGYKGLSPMGPSGCIGLIGSPLGGGGGFTPSPHPMASPPSSSPSPASPPQSGPSNGINHTPAGAAGGVVGFKPANESFCISELELSQLQVRPEQLEKLQSAWLRVDRSAVGSIRKEDVVGLCKSLGLTVEPQHLQQLTRRMTAQNQILFKDFLFWWAGV